MDDLKSTFSALGGFIKRMSASQALMLLGVTAGSVVGLVVFTNYVSTVNYSVLYSNLDQSAAADVVAYLEDNKTSYEITNGGRTIRMADSEVHRTRMALASQGLPARSSVGYSIFDENNFGMTDFLQKINYKRALEGELTRTIMEISEIRAARVHIVMPKERLFSKDQKVTTASILLKLGSGELTRRQLSGIKHLVASSVEGLKPSRISIIDYDGNLLSSNNEQDALAGLSSSQLQVRKDVESYLEHKAQSMLNSVIGMGASVVRISVELDFTQSERTNELFDPNGAVIRSEERTEQSSNVSDKVADNTAESAEDTKQETVITNYEIPRTVETIVNSVGVIKRLSIAVMLDGIREEVVDEDGETTIRILPRAQEDIDRLSAIVKSAVGFDGNRNDQIEVFNMTFDKNQFDSDGLETVSPGLYFYMDMAKQVGGWLLILIVVLFVRKKVKNLFAGLKAIVPAPVIEPDEAVAEAIHDEVTAIKIEKRRPKLIDQMQQTAKERPEELAKVIKTMMVAD